MALSNGLVFGLVVTGVALAGGLAWAVFKPSSSASSDANSGSNTFNPYPQQGAAPPAQDDTARAVSSGLDFASNALSRFLPSADARLAADQRRADAALEQERFRACIANPTAPICSSLSQTNGTPGLSSAH